MVEMRHVSVEGSLTDVSFFIEPAQFASIITEREPVNDLLVRLLLGFDQPDTGTILVMDADLNSLSAEDRISLRKIIGIVPPGGGLISNLRIWENVTLPLAYHTSLRAEEIESQALSAIKRVGYQGSLNELPGNLPKISRTLIGFARMLLVRPQVVIYNSTFEGLPMGDRERLIRVAGEFHRESPARISLLITANQVSAEGLPVDKTFSCT